MFADTEPEVTSLGEVALAEFVFLDLQSTLEDFFGLWSSNGHMHSDLFVTADTKCPDRVSSLACRAEGQLSSLNSS